MASWDWLEIIICKRYLGTSRAGKGDIEENVAISLYHNINSRVWSTTVHASNKSPGRSEMWYERGGWEHEREEREVLKTTVQSSSHQYTFWYALFLFRHGCYHRPFQLLSLNFTLFSPVEMATKITNHQKMLLYILLQQWRWSNVANNYHDFPVLTAFSIFFE